MYNKRTRNQFKKTHPAGVTPEMRGNNWNKISSEATVVLRTSNVAVEALLCVIVEHS